MEDNQINVGLQKTNNNKSKNIFLIAIVGILIICVGALLAILLLNKSNKNDKKVNDKNLPSAVLSKVQTSGEMMIGKERLSVEAKSTDTLLSLVSNKSNLYGVKLGLKGTIDRGFCSFNPESINYEFVDADSNNPSFKTDGNDKMNIKLGSIKNLKSAYYLGFGGCNSSSYTPILIQYNDKLKFYSPYNGETSEIKIDKDYVMFYVLNLDTGVCDVACNEGITSYLIGETSDGKMYIFDNNGSFINVENVVIDAETIDFEDENNNKMTTVVYGISMSSGENKITGFE